MRNYQVGDLVEYKLGFAHKWRPGTIWAAWPRGVQVQDEYTSELHTIRWGKRGKVRDLHGAKLLQVQHKIEERKRAMQRPVMDSAFVRPVLAVLVPPLLRPVVKPSAPARLPDLKRYVKQHPCCICDWPAPSDPHHTGRRGVGQTAGDETIVPLCRRHHDQVQSPHALPGLSRHKTAEYFNRVRLAILEDYVAGRPARASWRETGFVLELNAVEHDRLMGGAA